MSRLLVISLLAAATANAAAEDADAPDAEPDQRRVQSIRFRLINRDYFLN